MDFWWIGVALSAAAVADGDRWAAELVRLDLHRARAFALADPALLATVYADEGAAADDAELIEDYAAAGGRVTGAAMTYHRIQVLSETKNGVELAVVDQLSPSRVVWSDGTSTELPRDQPTRRVIVLKRTESGYLISQSRLQGPGSAMTR